MHDTSRAWMCACVFGLGLVSAIAMRPAVPGAAALQPGSQNGMWSRPVMAKPETCSGPTLPRLPNLTH